MHKKASKTAARRIIAAERRLRALELRKQGYSYTEIGKAVGTSAQHAHRMVVKELERISAKLSENADELRELQLERLRDLLLALWPKAAHGNLQVIDRVLKILQEISKLTGIAAPERHELTGPGGSQIVERVVVMIGGRKNEGEDGA